jgi:hypothetical protein
MSVSKVSDTGSHGVGSIFFSPSRQDHLHDPPKPYTISTGKKELGEG